jgi:hypothetical protein
MAHKREYQEATGCVPSLLSGIGCALGVEPERHADIEYTLFLASEESLTQLDFRILGLVVQWIDIHDSQLNHPRLLRFVKSASEHTQRFWKAMAQWRSETPKEGRKWHRFLLLEVPSSRFTLLPVGTAFHIQRKGEDPRFENTDLRIPMGVFRVRSGDVLSKKQLVAMHRSYANRIRFGVCLRADLWSMLEEDPSRTPSQLAKMMGCAFASAWKIKQDFLLFS